MTRLLTVALIAAATSAIGLRADEDLTNDPLLPPAQVTTLNPPAPASVPATGTGNTAATGTVNNSEESESTVEVESESTEEEPAALESGETVDGYDNLEFFNGVGGKNVVNYEVAKAHCEARGTEQGKTGRLAVLTDKSDRDAVHAKVAGFMPPGSFRKFWVGFKGEGANRGPEKLDGDGTLKGFGNWTWADGTSVSIAGDFAEWHKKGDRI